MKWLTTLSTVALLAVGCSGTSNSGEQSEAPDADSWNTSSPTPHDEPDHEEAVTPSERDENHSSSSDDDADHSEAEDDTDSVAAERLAECGLDERDIAFMQRDWQRVVDSVGREDHREYTGQFVEYLTSLQKTDERCPADEALTDFIDAAKTLDESAGDPVEDYAAYSQITESGNEWLNRLGITPIQLAAG